MRAEQLREKSWNFCVGSVVILSNLILSACFIPHLFLSLVGKPLEQVGAGLGSIFLLKYTFPGITGGRSSMVSP